MADKMIHGIIENGSMKVVFADTKELVSRAVEIHKTSCTASAALGRALTMTAMLTAGLKDDKETVTVTVDGGGIGGRLVLGGMSKGRVKGYIDNPEAELPLNSIGKLDVSGLVGKKGMLTIVRDMGLKEPYIGRSRLISGELAEDFAYYLTVSEQTPSLVSLGVRVDTDKNVLSAGGILIQAMPGCEDSVIDRVMERSSSFGDISGSLLEEKDSVRLMNRLFEGLNLQVLEECIPAFECDCSRDRVERALIAMGHDELIKLRDEDGGAELSCSFCNRKYTFDYDELTALAQG